MAQQECFVLDFNEYEWVKSNDKIEPIWLEGDSINENILTYNIIYEVMNWLTSIMFM